ncbi:putative arsenite efflux transporter [Gonapodya prolifera JEL478]|uniref:Putative arsenite efflux transporter n=1 Tax=Gonapodya prolifera (strain JEL478) TaxID=1344416 RepID=A0A139AI76_GONPJ|nr:putative arsenite efflux transporter [Gonapodya prolifera JEL478]|eukprot:KXS16512.1 putative arsenite efflux transporter [Gonapodya prolifera JEL478]
MGAGLLACDNQSWNATADQTQNKHPGVIRSLSSLGRFLPIWIFLAMAGGILLGNFSAAARDAFGGVEIVNVSLPIAIGLLAMIRVKYETLPQLFRHSKMARNVGVSLFINWVAAPLIMAGLAWMTLPDLPGYRTGIIIVGGDAKYSAILVAINSILQILLFSPIAYFLVVVVSRGGSLDIGIWLVTRSVLIFLGVPLGAGAVTRFVLRFAVPAMLGREEKGATFYDNVLMKWLGPISLIGLLYTILVMFTIQGQRIITEIVKVIRVAVPLILYFGIVFTSTFYLSIRLGLPYSQCATQAFTAAGNNFELAIAVSIATFGVGSPEAVAAVVGPLVEVPVFVSLVYVEHANNGI